MLKIIVGVLMLTGQPLSACTSFLTGNSTHFVVAKNFDWKYGHGLLMVNKRNVQKIAAHAKSTDRPLLWTSKYGSVTFNQIGREFPYGGMNEKGLVIETLWLDKTEYPDEVPGIVEADVPQWVQTMLDRAATVDDVANLTSEFQVRSRYGKVHFFVCDVSRACAVFEFLNKSLYTTRLEGPKDLKLLTNDPYKVDQAKIKEYEAFDGTREMPKPQDGSSLARFVKTAALLKDVDQWRNLIPSTFETLERGAKSNETQWRIVYDPENLKIFFKTTKKNALKEINLHTFDWSCASPVKVLDINTSGHGEVSGDFEDYKDSLNSDIVEKSLFIPKEAFPHIEEVPSTDHCG